MPAPEYCEKELRNFYEKNTETHTQSLLPDLDKFYLKILKSPDFRFRLDMERTQKKFCLKIYEQVSIDVVSNLDMLSFIVAQQIMHV